MSYKTVLDGLYRAIKGEIDCVELWGGEYAFVQGISSDGFRLVYTRGDDYNHMDYSMYDSVWEAMFAAMRFLAGEYDAEESSEEQGHICEGFLAEHEEEFSQGG